MAGRWLFDNEIEHILFAWRAKETLNEEQFSEGLFEKFDPVEINELRFAKFVSVLVLNSDECVFTRIHDTDVICVMYLQVLE